MSCIKRSSFSSRSRLGLILGIALLVACSFPVVHDVLAQQGLTKDSQGWTVFDVANANRVHYVSASSGNDTNGKPYPAARVSWDPFSPPAPVQAYRTIDAVPVQAGDWVLLKRGDTFVNQSLPYLPSGPSPQHRTLVGAYGTGDRPVLKTGDKRCVQLDQRDGFENLAFLSFDCYAHTRDPNSPDFAGWNTDGSIAGAHGLSATFHRLAPAAHLLIEDVRFRFYESNVLQKARDLLTKGGQRSKDIVIRRSQVTDAHDTAIAKGWWMSRMDNVTFEENIFIHNGWLNQRFPDTNERDSHPGWAQATMYNHNIYFSDMQDLVFRRNFFIQGSSMGTKFTANSGECSFANAQFSENIYIDNEVHISIGGNTPGPRRFCDISITDNLYMHQGRSRQTLRTLGWGIDVQAWKDGIVSDNILANQSSSDVNNVWGINVKSSDNNRVEDVIVENNRIIGLRNARYGIGLSGTDYRQLTVRGNTVYTTPEMEDAYRLGSANTNLVNQNNITVDCSNQQCPVIPSIDEMYVGRSGDAAYQQYIAAMRTINKNNWSQMKEYLAPALLARVHGYLNGESALILDNPAATPTPLSVPTAPPAANPTQVPTPRTQIPDLTATSSTLRRKSANYS